MGYTAVKGGLDAILAAEALIGERDGRLDPVAVGRGAWLLIDQVMGEGGLYAPELAALAIAQAEGDPIESAFLLRAYRSTLPRLGYTLPAEGRRMRVLRRISSTFKDIPGGQVLGRTRDYTQRLLDVDGTFAPAPPTNSASNEDAAWPDFPSVVAALRDEGLVRPLSDDPTEPADITRDALRFPAPRSARLQALARGETGFMVAIGYSAQRGLGGAHPTIAELRSGELPIQIQHPLTHDPVVLGAVTLTEVEMINHTAGGGIGGPAANDGTGEASARFDLGYGLAFGQHERKAIAMSIIDASMNIPGGSGPATDEEFVLSHCDALESSGFVEHLKLPHYVTFQSALDRVRFRRLAQLARHRSRSWRSVMITTPPATPPTTLPRLAALAGEAPAYNYAFLDEVSKREIRRALLKSVAIPGYQVPFGSREMPIARGWGSGGLQVTLSTIGPGDTLKVIDQGTDAGVNAVNIRRLVERTAPGVATTYNTAEATIVQSRHRFPEEPLRADQIMVLQVPLPEPLRMVEPRESVTRQLHAEADYTRVWVHLYEDVITNGEISRASGYPVLVNRRYVMSPSPIPRWDIAKLHQSASLTLLGAGREKRIYAVPPHTDVVPLDFEDYPFRVESFAGKRCARCGATDTYLDEIILDGGDRLYSCSDTAHCDNRMTSDE